MILYVDMDGVIADFEAGVKILKPDIEWKSTEVDKICESNPSIFNNLPEIPGAINAVKYLESMYDIYFLSTPMQNVPESFTGKRLWIRNKFGAWANKRLILTHRKDLCLGDYLIDDRTANGAGEFKGIHIHFGTNEFPNWEKTIKFLENEFENKGRQY